MKKILLIIFLTFFWPITSHASDLTEPNEIFAAIHEIKTKGSYKGKTGYIMRKNNEKNYSKFPIKLPDNSAPIVSDYKSKWGAGSSPGKRKKKHFGVDFYLKPGSPILAANDGAVLFAKYLKCEGNVMTIKHTGNLYASYLHIGDFKVKKGDKVNRGQLIAEAGTSGTTKCSGTIEHLHLQTSKEGPCHKCTGSWKYLGKKQSWTNPHKHWTGGKGKPQCFVADIEYPKKLLTLPFQCKKI